MTTTSLAFSNYDPKSVVFKQMIDRQKKASSALEDAVVTTMTDDGASNLGILSKQIGHQKLNLDNELATTLPKMPEFLVCVPFIDKTNNPKVKQIAPGMNILLMSNMHQQYDEAETMTLKHLLRTRLKKDAFFRGFTKKTGYYTIEPQIQTIYEDVFIWPKKVHQVWWAAGRKNKNQALEQTFGALEYTDIDGSVKRVSILEAFSGPMQILLNCLASGTLLAQMVKTGSTNPTVLLGNLNGPVTDPSVVAASQMATSLNIPVTFWKDDTQSLYGGTDNPLLMATASNQSIFSTFGDQNPISMALKGKGNFRWIDEAKGKLWGNAFARGFAGRVKEATWMNIPANPLQGIMADKSHNIVYTDTMLDRLKESVFYTLGNPYALRGQNRFISYPIPRGCDTAKCFRNGYTNPVSLPFSLKYEKLLILGDLLLNTVDENGNNYTSVYDRFKSSRTQTTQGLWSLQLAQAQWKYCLMAMKFIFSADDAQFFTNLNYYFDVRDVPAMHFLINFCIRGGIYDKNTNKFLSKYIPPTDSIQL